MRRNAYLGSDAVTYAENSDGYVYLTIPESPLKEGFVRKVADTVPQLERLWKLLDEQEKRRMDQLNEHDWSVRRASIQRMRDSLNARAIAIDVSPFERDFIKASLDVLDRKERHLYANRIYGVAAMQEKEAPLAPAPAVKETT